MFAARAIFIIKLGLWQKIELLKLPTEGDWEQNIKREQVDEGGTVALACQPVLAAAPLG